jgi:hypothetical protein
LGQLHLCYFQDLVFTGEEFQHFREVMKSTMMEDHNEPRIQLLQRVVPIIERELNMNNRLIVQQSEINRTFVSVEMKKLKLEFKSEFDIFREVNRDLNYV